MKKFISAKMINLADPRIGSKIIFKTDDFFAAAHRILNNIDSEFKEAKKQVKKIATFRLNEIKK